MFEEEEFIDEFLCEGIVSEALQVPPINESSDAARLLDKNWSFVNPQLKLIPHFPSKLKLKKSSTMVKFL